jgi:hypothetical protein
MTSQNFASLLRYEKHSIRNRERTRSRVSMIGRMTNSGNSNKRQYERYDGISRIRKIHRQISLRE